MAIKNKNVQSNHEQGDEGYVEDKCQALLRLHSCKLTPISRTSPERKPVRGFVIDDGLAPRVAARALLGTTRGLAFVGEASTGAEALRALARLKVDLVLLDVHMPEMDGPETAKAILESHPNLKVVAWTFSESGDDLLRMTRAGCCGYVLKDAGPDELHRALMAAVRSETPLPRRMMPEILRRAATNSPVSTSSTVQLTPRQVQVLRGAPKAYSTKRIAQRLGVKSS